MRKGLELGDFGHAGSEFGHCSCGGSIAQSGVRGRRHSQ